MPRVQEAIFGLTRALEDHDPAVRMAAVDALGQMSAAQAADELKKLEETEQSFGGKIFADPECFEEETHLGVELLRLLQPCKMAGVLNQKELGIRQAEVHLAGR